MSANLPVRLKKLEAVFGSRRCQCEAPTRPEYGILEETIRDDGSVADLSQDQDTMRALNYACSTHGVVGPRLVVVVKHARTVCGGRSSSA